MRINLLLRLWRLNVFFMISTSQKIESVTSQADQHNKNLHYVFLDLENKDLNTVVEALREVQAKYKLSDIWLVSDMDKSYRAFCFSVRPWTTYLRIMLDLIDKDILDYSFFFWSVKRSKATLRTSNKYGRQGQKIVYYLPSNFEKPKFPRKVLAAWYTTGLIKRGITFMVGKEFKGLTVDFGKNPKVMKNG